MQPSSEAFLKVLEHIDSLAQLANDGVIKQEVALEKIYALTQGMLKLWHQLEVSDEPSAEKKGTE